MRLELNPTEAAALIEAIDAACWNGFHAPAALNTVQALAVIARSADPPLEYAASVEHALERLTNPGRSSFAPLPFERAGVDLWQTRTPCGPVTLARRDGVWLITINGQIAGDSGDWYSDDDMAKRAAARLYATGSWRSYQ